MINPTQVSGNLANFPVLISLTDSALRDKARDDGYDIVFAASDGTTQLAHEIEQFDGTTGKLVAWVKLPSLSSTAMTVLYMYYGNAAINSPTQNAAQVWDANFVGVWHLNESGNGTVAEYRDSSQFGNHGRGGQGNALYVPTRATGQIGYGQGFSNADGQYDLIDVGNAASLDITGNQITLEAWIRLTADPQSGKWYGILNHKGFYNGYRLIIPGNNPAPNNRALAFQLPGQTHDLRTARNVSPGTWQHVVARYGNSTMRVIIDGVPDVNSLSKSNNITAASPENHVWIGYGDQPTNFAGSYEWVGQLDEVRISNVARSPNWVQTEYNNQSAPSSFYTVGTETPKSVFCLLATNTPTNTATNIPKPTTTLSPTRTRTPSRTPTVTRTAVNSPTPTRTPSKTPTATRTAINSPTPTRAVTGTAMPTATTTPTITPTPTQTPLSIRNYFLPLVVRPYPCAPPQPTWQGGLPSGVVVDALLLGPRRDGKVVYAGAAASPGVYVSRDGGVSWPEVSAVPPVLSFAAHPIISTTVYAGTFGGGIYQSSDEGVSWSPLGSPDAFVWSLATVASFSSFTLYAGTDNGLYFSQPPFANWTAAAGPITGKIVYAIVNDPENGDLFAATSGNGVFKSVDGGVSWTQTALTSISVLSLAMGPSQTLYAGVGGQGVYRSANGGSTWDQLNVGLGTQSVHALALDPNDSQKLFAGTTGGGVFVSSNGAASWAAYNAGLSQANAYALALNAQCSGTLFVGTDNGVWRADTRSMTAVSSP